MKRTIFLGAMCLLLLPTAPTYAKAGGDEAKARQIRASTMFQRVEAAIAADYDPIVSDAVMLTEIPAPTFAEGPRGQVLAALFRVAGLSDVNIDAVGNVTGLRKGTDKAGGVVAVVAHLDTVFDKDVPIKVRRDGDRLYAPGIGDDSFALSVLAGYARALNAAGARTRSDILFVGSVGEEGLGNLLGIRSLLQGSDYEGRIDSVIVIEPAAPGQMITTGVGSIRYKVTFNAPGGHSFSDFGLVNPAYAMGRAMADFGSVKVDPATRTTYSIGLLSGGTSVNSIPASVAMSVDMRSDDPAALETIDAEFRAIVKRAAAQENATRSTEKGPVQAEMTVIGRRPAGHTPHDSALVRRVVAAMTTGGLTPRFDAHGTDANMPMSMGIPAIVIGHGVYSAKGHSPEEFILLDRDRDIPNMATALLAILLESGVTAH